MLKTAICFITISTLSCAAALAQAPDGYGAQYSQPAYGGQPQQYLNQAQSQQPLAGMSVMQWFNQYDQIRKNAQMSPLERQQADSLLSRGFSVLVPGQEKQQTKALLSGLVKKYQRACEQLRGLPQLNQTKDLHQAYYQYFSSAGQLFNDYLRVQDNLFVKDFTSGQPVAAGLLQRKQMLESIEHQCKMMDGQTRSQFGIQPYPY